MKQLIYLCILLLFVSCGERFLDIKPTLNQKVPSTIEDYLGMMDGHDMMNRFSSHALGMIGGDEYYMSDVQYNGFPAGVSNNYQKNAYTWSNVIYDGGEPIAIDWTRGYMRILWTNTVLEGIQKISANDTQQHLWNQTKGTALFFRALNYYNLAQLYTPVFDKSAPTKPGLPLRLEVDLTKTKSRASLLQTYQQVLADLEEASLLLPDFPNVVYRPSKWAAYALLAKVFLQMDNYETANHYAAMCLAMRDELIDFNALNLDLHNPFPLNSEGNPEVIFNTVLGTDITLLSTYYNPDTLLVANYDEGDLRKQAYFKYNEQGQGEYTGSYDGSGFGQGMYFTGLAIDEIFLIKAETDARLGNLTYALNALNQLRLHRYAPAHYTPLISDSDIMILEWVLAERKKELVMRGTRWEDLRRLNKSEDYKTILLRNIEGQQYQLLPNDTRYTWPLPLEAVRIGGYQQNER